MDEIKWSEPEPLPEFKEIGLFARIFSRHYRKRGLSKPKIVIVSQAYSDGYDAYQLAVIAQIPGSESAMMTEVTFTRKDLKQPEVIEKLAERIANEAIEEVRRFYKQETAE